MPNNTKIWYYLKPAGFNTLLLHIHMHVLATKNLEIYNTSTSNAIFLSKIVTVHIYFCSWNVGT